jgi:hypothetical protein
MSTILTQKDKIMNKWNFVENKIDIMQQILKMLQISLLHKEIKFISRSVCLCVFANADP